MASALSPTVRLLGACLCKQVKFSVPVSSVRFGFASCHCSICRKAHSAPFAIWTGLRPDAASTFEIEVPSSDVVKTFRSSEVCVRRFCSCCGTHVYIEYDSESGNQWAGEIHIPTALLDDASVSVLEEAMAAAGKPRYLHVFYSDRHKSLGDISQWAAAPKYGGATGLEPLAKSSHYEEEK